jgi:threonine synthase
MFFSLDEPIWRCKCGGLLDIDFRPSFPLEKIRERKPSMWRYSEAIPITGGGPAVSFGEGFTPLLEVQIAGRAVLVKQEHLFPTGSYKDRGAAVLISKIRELGIGKIVEDSSGNAGSAIAGYCAAAGIACDIYVPADTAGGKLAQIELYGANLHKVPGSREDTARAVFDAAQTVYYASHSWNPFFFHGTKTFAFEVAEQLDWNAPDALILPVGNGTLLLGAYTGFCELRDAGVVKKIPRIIGIQAENCAPLYHMETHGGSSPLKTEKTIAEGIAIAEPIRGRQIIEAVKTSGGEFMIVSETEIGAALIDMCRGGYFIEPTAAAAPAGVKKYLERTPPGAVDSEIIVSAFTGHGLKAGGKMLEIGAAQGMRSS